MTIDKTTEQIIDASFEDLIGERFSRYSKYIIQERALPDARDGLKPVQRRILYAMSHDGNHFDKPYRKSAKTVGLVIGNYHPHGDSSVYDALVRLSQAWKMNHPLIDMHGNNGSIDDDPAAAMRYTEARLAELAEELLVDLDKATVDLTANFDDTELEPVVLPASFPNLLINGATGIAAGYATNIPPHNMVEIIDAVIFRLQHPNCSLSDLTSLVKGPDFPTGGIVQGQAGIEEAFTTGKGRIVIRAKTEIITSKTATWIVVSELPYEVIKANVVKKIEDIRINKAIDGIIEVRDESDRNGLKLVIELKPESDPNQVLTYLLKNTDLQVYYNYNMVAIVDQRPVQLGLAQLIDAYLVHREEVVLKRSRFLLNKLSNRSHILEGLMKATSIMDEIITLIRRSANKEDAKQRLIDAFDFSELQAEAIVNLRLYRLTTTDIVSLKEEYATLMLEIRDLRAIVEDKSILHSTIIAELRALKQKFGRPRLTEITREIEELVIDKTKIISNEKIMLTISQAGYVKNVSLRSYLASLPALPKVREDDQLLGYGEADSHDMLLAITSNGEYSQIPLYTLEEARWKDIGTHLNNYVKFDNFTEVIASGVINNFEQTAWLVSVTKLGMIKRSPLAQYELIRTSKSSLAMKLKPQDEIVATYLVQADDEILIATKQGFMIRYPVTEINPTAPRGMGVVAIRLSAHDEIATSTVLKANQTDLIIINQKGGVKRLKLTDIIPTNRAVKGERVFKPIKSNPVVVKNILVGEINDQISFINQEELVEIRFKEVPLMAKDATFSNPLELSTEWYVLPKLF